MLEILEAIGLILLILIGIVAGVVVSYGLGWVIFHLLPRMITAAILDEIESRKETSNAQAENATDVTAGS